MFELKFDLSDFEKQARALEAAQDQVPFALSLALNDAAFNARTVLIQKTWPEHVTVRNKSFMNAALRVVKSDKHNLRVEIFDRLGRANLKAHADGGTIRPVKAQTLAVPPPGLFKRGPRGIPPNKRPRAIIANTPKRALRITARGIYVGKGGRLQLMYAFKPSVNQPADVPFREDFRTAMLEGVRTAFPAAMARAMRTRR